MKLSAGLVLLTLLILPARLGAIGYDFSQCATLFAQLNATFSDLSPEQIEDKNREMRLFAIRMNERRRVKMGLKSLAVLLEGLAVLEGREKALERSMEAAGQFILREQELAAKRADEARVKGVQLYPLLGAHAPPVEDFFPPNSTLDEAAASEMIPIIVDAFVLSELRELFFERLVGAVPNTRELKTIRPEEAQKLFDEVRWQAILEMRDFYEMQDASESEVRAKFFEPGPGAESDAVRNTNYYAYARRVVSREGCLPFVKEEILRHVKFLSDFSLRPDQFFRGFVEAMDEYL